jgi:hypothetical protein
LFKPFALLWALPLLGWFGATLAWSWNQQASSSPSKPPAALEESSQTLAFRLAMTMLLFLTFDVLQLPSSVSTEQQAALPKSSPTRASLREADHLYFERVSSCSSKQQVAQP